MSYFDKNFKSKVELAAPVQSSEGGWRDYLSKRESLALDKAMSRYACSAYVCLGAPPRFSGAQYWYLA